MAPQRSRQPPLVILASAETLLHRCYVCVSIPSREPKRILDASAMNGSATIVLAEGIGQRQGSFSDTVLTVQRRRSGGKQVVQVIHQQVAAGAGGKAIVAGAVKERAKSGRRRGGSK